MCIALKVSTIVPLYLYPEVVNGVHNWQPLINAYKNHSIDVWAIVNTNSGPGSQLDSNYMSAINKLKEAGVKTLGYVRTNYGKQSISTVKSDINKWKSFYNPRGIFFDEMANTKSSSLIKYYKDINDYAKGTKGFEFTVGNPGIDTIPEYVNTVDTIMIYETDTGFPSNSSYSGWHDSYPKEKWGIFPFNLPNLEVAKILDAKKHVGFIYLTNDKLPNPWDSLPPYLDTLFGLLE